MLRIAAPDDLERVARRVAADLQAALGVGTEVIVYRGNEEKLQALHRLAEKDLPRDWDIFIQE